MTLTGLLKIDTGRIPLKHTDGLGYAEAMWREAKQPSEPQALAEFLEADLRNCVSLAITYPPVILLRRRQLLRGDFLAEPFEPDPPEPKPLPRGNCPTCGGTGFRVGRYSGSVCVQCTGKGSIALPKGEG